MFHYGNEDYKKNKKIVEETKVETSSKLVEEALLDDLKNMAKSAGNDFKTLLSNPLNWWNKNKVQEGILNKIFKNLRNVEKDAKTDQAMGLFVLKLLAGPTAQNITAISKSADPQLQKMWEGLAPILLGLGNGNIQKGWDDFASKLVTDVFMSKPALRAAKSYLTTFLSSREIADAMAKGKKAIANLKIDVAAETMQAEAAAGEQPAEGAAPAAGQPAVANK
jgi:hypothetical protein